MDKTLDRIGIWLLVVSVGLIVHLVFGHEGVAELTEAQVDCVYDQSITNVYEIAYVCDVTVGDVLELNHDE